MIFSVLETIKNARKWNDNVTENKEEQNSFRYNEEQSGELCNSTKEYLQITPDQILLNEEVVSYLREVEWNNSDTYIFDSDLDFANNSSIFIR